MLNFIKKYSLQELVYISGATSFIGSPNVIVEGLNNLSDAKNGQLTFLAEDNYVNNFKSLQDVLNTSASIVLLSKSHESSAQEVEGKSFILHNNPKLGLAKIMQECFDDTSSLSSCTGEKHQSAIISDKSTVISNSVSIGANVVIGNNCTIEDNVRIMPNVVIDDNVSIGAGTVIYPNVTIYKNCKIGRDCVIQSSAVIGSNGFGFARTEAAKWEYLPQVASVIIGDKVQIGASTCVDRGFISDTTIGDGCIIDNQVQIGHNVEIGADTAIAGCSGIAGSAKIGKRCMFGGYVGVAGHLSICDDVMLSASTCVNRSITSPGVYSSGMHAKPRSLWQKSIARFYKLDDMAKKLNRLEKTYSNELLSLKKEVEK